MYVNGVILLVTSGLLPQSVHILHGLKKNSTLCQFHLLSAMCVLCQYIYHQFVLGRTDTVLHGGQRDF